MELSKMIPKLLIMPFYLKIIILFVFVSFDRYASNPRYMGPEFSIYTCIDMCRVMYPHSIFTDDTNINIKSYQISLR